MVIWATQKSSYLQGKGSTYTVPSFLSYLETLIIGPVLEIEPMTSHSAVEHSADWG